MGYNQCIIMSNGAEDLNTEQAIDELDDLDDLPIDEPQPPVVSQEIEPQNSLATVSSDASPAPSIDTQFSSNIPTTILGENETKQFIDNLATKHALSDASIFGKLVEEKGRELQIDAQTKSTKADAGLLSAHSEKIDEEARKLDKEKKRSEAFYEANKAVLRIIGIREPLGYRTMLVFYGIGLPLYILFSVVISFPVAIIKFFIDVIVDTVGDISKKVASTFLKVTTGILSIGIAAAIIVGFVFLFRWIFGFM